MDVTKETRRDWKLKESALDIYGSVHHTKILIKMTNKVQLYRTVYYSIVLWLLYMFRAILSLIIRSALTVITPSVFIHMYYCRLTAADSNMCK
jgi:hypothetical protein